MDALYIKPEYQTPKSEVVEVEINGIICQSNEPIDPGQGHGWD